MRVRDLDCGLCFPVAVFFATRQAEVFQKCLLRHPSIFDVQPTLVGKITGVFDAQVERKTFL